MNEIENQQLTSVDEEIEDCFSMPKNTKMEQYFSFSKEFNPDSSTTKQEDPNIQISEAPQKNYGATPPIDGEFFTYKRSYQLRQSTLRKLNELKLFHSDVNVHLNTIIDKAINNLYELSKTNNKQRIEE